MRSGRERIKHFIEKKRLTQEKFALRVGVSPALISGIEHGKKITKETAEKLALVMKCKPHTLMEWNTKSGDTK